MKEERGLAEQIVNFLEEHKGEVFSAEELAETFEDEELKQSFIELGEELSEKTESFIAELEAENLPLAKAFRSMASK